jgi:RNA polymerase sigma factor (sigma-70 family)
MSQAPLDRAVRRLRRAADPDTAPDGELLRRYADRGDGEAFAALVRRHGPLVLGVCRRVLGDAHDAEDAFQAAFLVLARRASAACGVRSLAGWLHGVALRVAQKARVQAARRRAREKGVAAVREPEDPFAEVDRRDLRAVLDEELDRLGEKYRAPLALCYLEGKTHEEAARELGWPNGTVCGRLARGRDLLRRRLARRGLACAPAVLAAALGESARAAVPAALAAAAVRAATVPAAAPAAVAGLADGFGVAPAAARLRTVLALAALAALGTGAGLLLPAREPAAEPAGAITADEGRPGVVRLRLGEPVLTVAASDGLVAAAGGGPTVRVWRAGSGEPVAACPGHEGGVAALAFAPDGRTLATAGYDGAVRLWDPLTGRPLRTLPAHEEAACSLAFAPDGRTLASAGWDGRVRLWDVGSGRPGVELAGHRGRAWAVAFTPDGRSVVSGGGDRTVRTWDAATGREVGRFSAKGGVYALALTPDGRTLATAEENTVCLRDFATGGETGRVAAPQTEVVWFVLAPDGRTLAWGGADRSVRLYELAAGAERLRLDGHEQPVGCLTFAPDGRSLVSGGGDGTAVVWDLPALLRPARTAPPTPRELEALWADLAGADARRAYRALWALAAAPDRAVPFLQDRLHARPGFEQSLDRLTADLDSPSYSVRERATRELGQLGDGAVPALRRALERRPSLEARRRVERLLARPTGADAPALSLLRAVEALELAGTPEARAALAELAGRAPEARLTREAAAALGRLGRAAVSR